MSEAAPTPTKPCLNCGEVTTGVYCSACGQKVGLSPRSLRVASAEVLGNVFSYDNRVWRSLVHLLLRPGSLTKAWIEGRRTSFFDPLRMFLFLSVMVFLAPDTIIVEDFEGPVHWTEPAEAGATFTERLSIGAGRIFALKDLPEEQVSNLLDGMAVDYLMLYAALGILGMALVMRLLHWGTYFVEHFVFALHYASFIFLTNLIMRLVFPDIGNTDAERWSMLVLQVLYPVLAFQLYFAKPGFAGRTVAALRSVAAFLGFTLPYMQAAQLALALELMPPAAVS